MATLTPKVITPPYVYLDDSGCNTARSAYFTWAGYWASYAFWEKFGNAWNKILTRSPEVPPWHQTDVRSKNRVNQRKNKFRGFDEIVLKRKERSLAHLLFKNRELFGTTVIRVAHKDIEEYAKGKIRPSKPVDEGQRRALAVLESPEFITLCYAAANLVEEQKRGPEAMPLSVYCEAREQDRHFQDSMLFMWRVVKRMSRDSRMGDLDFKPGKTRDVPQLQAADMLAWHVNRLAEGRPDEWSVWPKPSGRGMDPITIERAVIEEQMRGWSRLPVEEIPRL